MSAYGGVQLPEEAVHQVAQAIASGAMPMHFSHDITRPLAVANLTAGTERLEDGHLAAWAEFDVDEDVWSAFQDEVRSHNAPSGMSISFTTPLEGEDFAPDAWAEVAADAHHFSDDQVRAAAAQLRRLHTSAAGERLYQFSAEPIPKVVFDIVVSVFGALGPNIAASILYDAAKVFLRRGQKPVFNVVFRETRRGTRKIQIQIEPTSDAELKAALEALPAILQSGAEGTFVHHADAGYKQLEAPDADEIPG